MTDPNEAYAYFTVVGEFDTAEITRELGIPATESWKKGDETPRTRRERKFSRWSLYSRLDRSEPIDAHICDVLAQLDANRAGFSAVARKHGGTLQLIAYFNVDYPGLHFNADLVQSLSAFHLSVDFDFYFWHSSGRKDS